MQPKKLNSNIKIKMSVMLVLFTVSVLLSMCIDLCLDDRKNIFSFPEFLWEQPSLGVPYAAGLSPCPFIVAQSGGFVKVFRKIAGFLDRSSIIYSDAPEKAKKDFTFSKFML